MRPDGRANDQIRAVKLTPGVSKYAEGSCLIEMGDTRVLCTASIEERVPGFLSGAGEGWVTAEYAMLPRAGSERSPRESRTSPQGRSLEIQRLIGRSLRAVTDLRGLGERTITLDCDGLQADGGTRTAGVTGAFVALAFACDKLRETGAVKRLPLRDHVAAISVGIVAGQEALDLCYLEDSRAGVDLNLVMCGRGQIVEVQGTAEGTPFGRPQLDRLLDLGAKGIRDLVEVQRQALGSIKV